MELHLVGGFLGSGKTTAILEAARLLMKNGKRVGIITNEQGKHLVDTAFLRASGMPALEVAGGCICCHLDDFEDRIAEITAKFNPQVLFAESVGSCADLVATVIKPLTDYHKTSAHPTSFSVFTDSRLLLRYLQGMELPFNEGIIYIFEKQIEEANLLIVNKIDLLPKGDIEEVMLLAEKRYPDKFIRLQNSLEPAQVAEWLELIQDQTRFLPDQSLKINYDTYAEGEGSFAWLDRELNLTFSAPNPGRLVGQLILRFVKMISEKGLHIAHLKFLARDCSQAIKINLTSQDNLDGKTNEEVRKLDMLTGIQITLLINAMVEGSAALLDESLDTIIKQVCNNNQIISLETARFSRVPGYPKPTLRIGF
jgi:Ni2+-binding GTPase involved in maturation of urease and hydrogenase